MRLRSGRKNVISWRDSETSKVLEAGSQDARLERGPLVLLSSPNKPNQLGKHQGRNRNWSVEA